LKLSLYQFSKKVYSTGTKLYRVQDPAFKLAVKTRQSFTINIGDIILEAVQD